MARYAWDLEKNRSLKADARRYISFEEIVAAIESGNLLANIEHPNSDRYSNQRVLVVAVNDYVYAVPYVRTDDVFFLNTAFQSRKLNARYLPGVRQ